ncbi:hypothetical protein TNCT_87081 [Trichonephila clavata]|uniref:Uncharacterized protein n=1 Tax=Trichonephila clavata TaxID=2740835 RepID=A0A8X6LGU5_TRICU|nr:hypothetical protein TNCT_87081 [Trichonephila clavata]
MAGVSPTISPPATLLPSCHMHSSLPAHHTFGGERLVVPRTPATLVLVDVTGGMNLPCLDVVVHDISPLPDPFPSPAALLLPCWCCAAWLPPCHPSLLTLLPCCTTTTWPGEAGRCHTRTRHPLPCHVSCVHMPCWHSACLLSCSASLPARGVCGDGC